MKRAIYKGFYYPVIGTSNGWENGKTKQIIERRFGGWKNWEKWWSFSYGIKVKLFNPDKPYRQFVIDAINNNINMIIKKEYYDDTGEIVYPDEWEKHKFFYMYSVYTHSGEYIGDIRTAYYISNLRYLRSQPNGNTICAGWSEKDQKYYGWSHRAKVGFGIGDKIFDPDFGDENTLFTEHGEKVIKTFSDAKTSALNFAKYV